VHEIIEEELADVRDTLDELPKPAESWNINGTFYSSS